MRIVNLLGQRFGRWIVIAEDGIGNHGHRRWLCQCDCGIQKSVASTSLVEGTSVSCGCFRRELQGLLNENRPRKHGLSHMRAYGVWKKMMLRCYDTNDKAYKYYGERGIQVCERWHCVENFFEDMGEPPESLTLERKSNNLGYSPDNCVWATVRDQARNRRNNVYLELNGRRQLLTDWANELGVRATMLRRRQLAGWTDEMVLTTPSRIQNRIHKSILVEYQGKKQSLIAWAEETGIPYKALMKRFISQWPTEKMLTTPSRKKT